MATENRSVEEQKQSRGDFIHGANWALKFLRDKGFHPAAYEIRGAAAERFPTTKEVPASAYVSGLTITALNKDSVSIQRDGYANPSVAITRSEVDLLDLVMKNKLNGVAFGTEKIGHYALKANTLSYKRLLFGTTTLAEIRRLLDNPVTKVEA